MKSLSMQILVVLLLLSINGNARGNTTQPFTITWAINDAPPFHIMEGELQGGGMCDVLIDIFKKQMKDTSFNTLVMPQSRIKMLTKQKENLCFPCLIKRADNDVWLYSDITVYHAPLGIIGKPEMLEPYVDSQGRISLRHLIEAKLLRMGKPIARRYPDVLQPYVDSVQSTPLLAELSGENATTRVLEQIEFGRIDFTLEYPSILKYYSATSGSEELMYYETAELATQRIAGAVGCTNNEWGRKAVERMNKVIPYIITNPIYKKQQGFWYGTLTPSL